MVRVQFLRGHCTILKAVNIIMHPNGLYAFIANSNANKIEIIDMKKFTIVSTIGTGNVPDSMIFVQ
jgi:DNA-binding beta-propeller fold protein YncE